MAQNYSTPLGLSTSWRTADSSDGNLLLDEIRETGIEALELDYRLSSDELGQMKRRLKSSEFTVLTVHNYCPLPGGVSKSEARGDLFLLSSTDPEQRLLAVRHSINTLRLAADLEARAVVFHLGGVEMDEERDRLIAFYDRNEIGSERHSEWLQGKLAERARCCARHFDAVLKSLDALNEEAFRLGVLIGAENRYRYTQIPFAHEFDILFKEFAGGLIRYWHDVGHAEIFHRLGILDHEKDLLARLAPHLIGMHIHDLNGLRDHIAPGTGDFNFSRLSRYMNPGIIPILEVHGSADATDLRNSVQLLKAASIPE